MAKSYFKNWLAYRKAFLQQREVRIITKHWPPEEKRLLIDQIRRSTRGVIGNLAESFAKRRYPKHFISKITDAAAENYETQAWLDVAADEKYINRQQYESLIEKSEEIGKLLSYMEANPEKF